MANAANPSNPPAEHALFNQIAQRLERIEKKQDSMADAVLVLARTEERVTHLMGLTASQNSTVIKLADRVNELEKQNSSRTTVEKWFERGIWSGLSAAIVIGVTKYLS